MAKATIVYFERIWGYDKTTRIFQTLAPKKAILLVKSFQDGIAIVDNFCGFNNLEIIEIVVGCFLEGSNFEYEVLKAFNCQKTETFKGMKVITNDSELVITKNGGKVEVNYNAGKY